MMSLTIGLNISKRQKSGIPNVFSQYYARIKSDLYTSLLIEKKP